MIRNIHKKKKILLTARNENSIATKETVVKINCINCNYRNIPALVHTTKVSIIITVNITLTCMVDIFIKQQLTTTDHIVTITGRL